MTLTQSDSVSKQVILLSNGVSNLVEAKACDFNSGTTHEPLEGIPFVTVSRECALEQNHVCECFKVRRYPSCATFFFFLKATLQQQ
jgi:hypothetical protein